MNKRAVIWVVIVALVVIAFVAIVNGTAKGTEANSPCVPKEPWTEVIEHPEESHYETVVVTPEVPAVAAVWANFQPNNTKGTFVGPAVWPTDARGSWTIHKQLPPGHQGPDGVYAKGNPAKGGNWFYRQAGTPAVPAVTEQRKVVDKEAWQERIEHAAVVCESPTPTPTPPGDDPPPSTSTPTPTPSDTPSTPVSEPTPSDTPLPSDTPTVPTEPTVTPDPTDEPTPQPPKETKEPKPKPKPPTTGQLVECIDGVWVTTVDGKVISRSGTCDEDSVTVPGPVAADEEGM